jgi:hypothetical protein
LQFSLSLTLSVVSLLSHIAPPFSSLSHILPFPVPHSLTHSLSLFISISHSPSLFLPHYLILPLFLTVSLPPPLSFLPSVVFSLSHILPLYFPHSLTFSLSIFLALSHSHALQQATYHLQHVGCGRLSRCSSESYCLPRLVVRIQYHLSVRATQPAASCASGVFRQQIETNYISFFRFINQLSWHKLQPWLRL